MIECIDSKTPVCFRAQLLYDLARKGSTDPVVEAMATRARWSAPEKNNVSFAEQALKEVQRLPYVPDPKNEDCYRDVRWTARNGGECKGLNILYSAILIHLGMKAEPVWIMQPGKPLNHVATVVWFQGNPYWADASIPGAILGESPYEALERTGAYYVVGGKP